jgi:general secretion pathway protein B
VTTAEPQAPTGESRQAAAAGDVAEAASKPIGFSQAPPPGLPTESADASKSAHLKKHRDRAAKPPGPRASMQSAGPNRYFRATRQPVDESDESVGVGLNEEEGEDDPPSSRPNTAIRMPPSRPSAAATRPIDPAADRDSRSPEAPDDRLPRPKINVYAYSATIDRDRFIVVHGRKYHEGDRLEEGQTIRRIEEDAVTLDFQGQAYRVPRP